MDYLTASEVAEKWDITSRRVRILCNEGKVEGSIRKAGIWLIPEDAEKPDEYKRGRKKSNNPSDKKDSSDISIR